MPWLLLGIAMASEATLLDAAWSGDAARTAELIAAGADPNERFGRDDPRCSGLVDCLGEVGKVVALAVGTFGVGNMLEAEKRRKLLEEGKRTALHGAVEAWSSGDDRALDVVRVLLDAGAEPDPTTWSHRTPLAEALERSAERAPPIAEILLDAGHSPERGLACRAVEAGSVQVLGLLHDAGTDLGAPCGGEPSPIAVAATTGKTDLVAWLLEHGVDPLAHDALVEVAGRGGDPALLLDAEPDVGRRVGHAALALTRVEHPALRAAIPAPLAGAPGEALDALIDRVGEPAWLDAMQTAPELTLEVLVEHGLDGLDASEMFAIPCDLERARRRDVHRALGVRPRARERSGWHYREQAGAWVLAYSGRPPLPRRELVGLGVTSPEAGCGHPALALVGRPRSVVRVALGEPDHAFRTVDTWDPPDGRFHRLYVRTVDGAAVSIGLEWSIHGADWLPVAPGRWTDVPVWEL